MRPLHIACRNGHRDAVAALLDAGADAWAVDNIPWTPLHWLAKESNLEVAQLLLERAPPASASAQAAAREALALFADHDAARAQGHCLYAPTHRCRGQSAKQSNGGYSS